MKLATYKVLHFFYFFVVCLIIVCSYLSTVRKFPIEKELVPPRFLPKKIVILYWHPMFDRKDFYFGTGNIFEDCPHSNCYATYNKSFLPVEDFDAILFHGPEYTKSKHGVPKKRSPNQIYIYSNQESPFYTPEIPKAFNDFYNWTMTYRLDSDILRTYGMLFKNQTNYKLPTEETILNKTKEVAWMVSHCETISNREAIAKELQNLMSVDIYGKCGTYQCPRFKNEECINDIERQYKFYLSFENSYCKDYVTEKLFLYLQKNIIPIVYGGADYKLIAPNKSVIDADEFDSVEELVKYLKFLSDNPKEYLKYFEWKKHYVVETSQKFTLCSLCEKLNKPLVEKTYSDINTWWNGIQYSKCKYGRQLPKIIKNPQLIYYL